MEVGDLGASAPSPGLVLLLTMVDRVAAVTVPLDLVITVHDV